MRISTGPVLFVGYISNQAECIYAMIRIHSVSNHRPTNIAILILPWELLESAFTTILHHAVMGRKSPRNCQLHKNIWDAVSV